MAGTFYITTPIFYPNGKAHLGHAYTTTLCDVLARYHRLIGDETYFLTGTDENSEKVLQAAEATGKDVETFTDDVVAGWKQFYAALDISFNHFIRTTDKDHHWPGPIALWKAMEANGDIYKGTYEGLYCVGCESFKTEKELDADGHCPDHHTKPKILKEENYFFRLSKYQEQIHQAIANGEMVVAPEARQKEILAFIEAGLEDISFSRPKHIVPWGIPVPGDEEHVMYVWADALTNYISALGYGRDDATLFDTFWPAQANVVGKDILRFHAAIWPGMLLSAGVALPKMVFVHGLIQSGGRKMSKSLGNIIDPQQLIDEYGAEAVRYYLAREISPAEDGDITLEKFKEAYNGNLANGLGNLVSRIMKMIVQYDVDLSNVSFEHPRTYVMGEEVREYRDAFADFRIDRAADFVWQQIGFMDSYITETEPFKTIKEDPEKAEQDLLFLAERLWEVSVLLLPFLPETAEKIQEGLEEREAPANLFARKD